MEIRELLEIMLDNVNQGREAAHGLIGYNGTVNVQHPEQVFRKPPIHITFDEFREIRNTPDHVTAHYRLNLVVDKLIEKRLAALTAPPVVMPYVIPEGYMWNEAKGHDREFYGRYRADGMTDEGLIRNGYLLPVQKSALTPLAPEFFKPFVPWVSGGCSDIWPNPNYLFTESQFSHIKYSAFRVLLVEELNRARAMSKPFAGIVRNTYVPSNEADYKTMEEIVNKRLNEIYQKL